MAVYGFLNEALETKDSESKGKLKKLIDRVKSMMNGKTIMIPTINFLKIINLS